ncbi:MAG: FKBP-type peptidyl-prolyl cis-trans isomerase [Puniceicoccales bacterium]
MSALSAMSLSAIAEDQADSKEMSPPALFGFMVSQQVGLDQLGFSDEEKAEFLSGFQNGLSGGSMEDIQDQLPQLQQFLQQRAMAAQAKEMAKEKEATAVFVEDLESNPDIQKDETGFYYEIIEEGDGDTPSMSDDVVVNYQGALIDGTIFDSSYERGEPATFPMNGVIPGFSGGLSKISEGGKVRIYIPSELGYGDNPPPQSPIPAGAMLIFDAEIIDVVSTGAGE